MVVSVVFAWYLLPFGPPDREVGIYATSMSLPRTFSAAAEGQIPSVGQLFLALGLLAATLALLGEGTVWMDVARRVLGVAGGLVVGFVAFRLSQAFQNLPEDLPTFPGVLRAGFYLAALGSLLTVVFGRLRRG
jgi:hypothetical protein